MVNHIGQQFGNYRLIQLLGKGGFAEVYLAEHNLLKRKAAIKILHASLSSEKIKDFQQEATMIAGLSHPHIIRVLDFAVQNGTPYLVLDYAPGSLSALHPRGNKLSLDLVVSYVTPLASALQYAHERKVIHRDVKPENMLLGLQEELLLTDFGIATVAHSTSSLPLSAVMGTAAYMAPEQIQGKPRPASDQYALAVTVYQWLTGDLPFVGPAPVAIAQHLQVAPPLLRTSIPDLPSKVEQVVLKALAKDHEQRWACVLDFALALQEASRTASSAHVPAPQVRPASQDNPAARSDTRWASPEAMGASTSPSTPLPDTSNRFFPPPPTMNTGQASVQAPLCPLCCQIDRVEKVRGLVASGNSALCRQLSFPEPPAQRQQKSSTEAADEMYCRELLGATGGCCLLIVVGGIIVIGLGLRIGFLGGPASNFLLPGAILLILGVIGGICLLGSFVMYRMFVKREEKEANLFEEGERQRAQKRAKAYAQWKRLYYCARDDLVFFPGVSNWWVAAHELQEKITQQYY